MFHFKSWGLVTALVLCLTTGAQAGQSGQAKHEDVLLGMHLHHARTDCNSTGRERDTVPSFWDYTKYMPEDLRHISYADFWHWWSEFERYKGDEKGLTDFDAIVDGCLARGMKVKVDLAWSTWWTLDKDWEKDPSTVHGPNDLDDWVHLCDLLGQRYHGRIALWMLQGEANNMDIYWQNASMEHVHDVYRLGYRAFKRVDPEVLISVAGASPSVPKEALAEWIRSHATACKGLYDDIPMNYFGDIADPYKGLINYYKSIRKILDDLGQYDVEIGSGESAFQWAETCQTIEKNPPTSMKDFDPEKTPLCELKQAWRCNESLGTFFDAGGNKFVQWGTEYAPGLGWAWRWGFRKYQDWLGIWPDQYKVPGTNIVFGNIDAEGRNVDLRPGWTSDKTSPFHPMWEVYKYWAQACPPGSEAIRLPAKIASEGPRVLSMTTYLRARDRCVLLVQNDQMTTVTTEINTKKTGWPDGTALSVRTLNETIDYATGARETTSDKRFKATVTKGKVSLKLPSIVGFTTVEIEREKPAMNAEFVSQALVSKVEIGRPMDCVVVLRNNGSRVWLKEKVGVGFDEQTASAPKTAAGLPVDVAPGQSVGVPVRLPASETTGYLTRTFRMRDRKSGWFGPTFSVSVDVADNSAPRKLVAFRELGQVRLKWFAPKNGDAVAYNIYRADGFKKPFQLLDKVEGTDYIDTNLSMDTAYYYHVAAINSKVRTSRPSNDDNAKALSKPRIYDARIVQHNVPSTVRLGAPNAVTITIKNTGSKSWDLSRPAAIKFYLNTMQQWGNQDEKMLPKFELSDRKSVEPGESVTLTAPYTGPETGRFENHWVMSIDVASKPSAYFGTPLLVETVVIEKCILPRTPKS